MNRLKTKLQQALKNIGEKGPDLSSIPQLDTNSKGLDINDKNPPVVLDEGGRPRQNDKKVDENSNNSIMPKFQFYSKLPQPDEVMLIKMREVAREMHLMKMSQNLLSHDELTELYRTFERYTSPPFGEEGDEKFMGFRNYKKMVAELNVKCQELLNPQGELAFVKLLTDEDPYRRVSITVLFNYVMRKVWLRQTRISLSMFDDTGEGFIREPQLENYIKELIPTLVQLNGMQETFMDFYLCTATRKFFFFLDANKTGRVKILDILCSGLIDEILDLREDEVPMPQTWFSLQSAWRVYSHFMTLDKDRNGMLQPSELACYSQGEMCLTSIFVERVFQECQTYQGEMDYRAYLDFVLAIENMREPQSIKYFFRVMDVDHKGYLDAFTLHLFYKDIYKLMEVQNTDRIAFDDVKDEMFDMIKPEDPTKITLQDLYRSGCGPTLFSIFTDFNGFWAHESRESSFADNQGQVGSNV